MRKLTERGLHLKAILQKKGFAVIEVYPGGAQDFLGIPRKKKGLNLLKEGLEKQELRGLRNDLSDHELDAATCSLVRKLFLEGRSITYGSSEDGIVMPPDSKKYLDKISRTKTPQKTCFKNQSKN